MPSPPHGPLLRRDGLRPLLLRVRPQGFVPYVQVAGELIHWHERIPLRAVGGGWHELRVQAPAGVYSYKYQLGDGRWLTDPHNPRTRSEGGNVNSVVVVDGTPEPVLHAPAPPWLFVDTDGQLVVRAALRRGEGERISVRWLEGDRLQTAAMERCAVEEQHLLFEARLPASARRQEYLFVLADGRVLGGGSGPGGAVAPFELDLQELQPRVPAWWRDAVVYTVLVDRFRQSGRGGAWSPKQQAVADRRRVGGDLDGVREALDYLADLGVTALHFTPIVVGRSAHRYDNVEPRTVDPALGGEPALKRLLEAAHQRDLRVLLDVSATHVHRDFGPFRDVTAHGERSRYWDWFQVLQHPFREGPDPGYVHYRIENWDEPLLNTANPEVADWLVGTFEHWARLGVDGFRVDAAAELPLELTRRIGEAVRAIQPESVLYAELIPDNSWRWTGRAVDAATDFVSQQALYDWLWRKTADAPAVAERLMRRRFALDGPSWRSLHFVGTHDQPRLASLLGAPEGARLALLLVLLRAGVPMLYYGDELGLSCEEPDQTFEDVWPDRQCMPWGEGAGDRETHRLVRSALGLRRERAVLRSGEEQLFAACGPEGAPLGSVLVLRRRQGDEVVDLLLNGGPDEQVVALPASAASGATVLLSTGEVALKSEAGPLRLGPWAGAVVERRMTQPHRLAWSTLREHNAALAVQSFREGALQTPTLPTQLYLTVTEGCNLRCRHCLNHSPERTRAGGARRLRPWLLEALRAALGTADYVAFTHGGESLTEPMLWDVLETIERERSGRSGRPDVHLLSNGMLLTEATTRRLVDTGVTSLSVSLDGATAATNDRIRQGAQLDRILAHLAAATRIARQPGVDLRVGVSFTALRSNVQELVALGRIAMDLGLDWVKVEELVPANPFARAEWIGPRDPRLRAAVEALRELVEPAGLVVVDHLSPPTGCACQGRDHPELARFRAADDFANRARLDPCRAAWERACVDPDGSLRAIDYHHPVAGTLRRQPLPALWNGPVLRRLRQEALEAIPEERRTRCGLTEAPSDGLATPGGLL